jgi:4-amino-4-deoxy-L-arabinose transferase-like glycosyltransferase
MGYPFELEWMEGGSLGQVSWILSGHKLYGPPSLEFTPWVYPPLYFYVSAAVSSMLSGGLLPLRLVSFVASLGSLAFIFAIAQRETGSRRAGWLSAGLFVATYQLGGTWFDLARVDSLFLVLSLAALYVLRFTESFRAALLAGVLISLSFFSKQTALGVATPVALFLVAVDWRRGLVFIATVSA